MGIFNFLLGIGLYASGRCLAADWFFVYTGLYGMIIDRYYWTV
jgi:hypothetical protein